MAGECGQIMGGAHGPIAGISLAMDGMGMQVTLIRYRQGSKGLRKAQPWELQVISLPLEGRQRALLPTLKQERQLAGLDEREKKRWIPFGGKGFGSGFGLWDKPVRPVAYPSFSFLPFTPRGSSERSGSARKPRARNREPGSAGTCWIVIGEKSGRFPCSHRFLALKEWYACTFAMYKHRPACSKKDRYWQLGFGVWPGSGKGRLPLD